LIETRGHGQEKEPGQTQAEGQHVRRKNTIAATYNVAGAGWSGIVVRLKPDTTYY
jgi:hypothetical protein